MNQISYKILSELEKQDSHVRALGKALKINAMTIARRLKELEDQNVVDFEQEGKNKVYTLKDSLEAREERAMLEHWRLVQLLVKYPRLRLLVERIQQQNIGLAIVFGSYACHSATKESDIDLYIETTDTATKAQLGTIDSKLSIKIGAFEKDSLLAKEIIKNHVILHGVDRYHELVYRDVVQRRQN